MYAPKNICLANHLPKYTSNTPENVKKLNTKLFNIKENMSVTQVYLDNTSIIFHIHFWYVFRSVWTKVSINTSLWYPFRSKKVLILWREGVPLGSALCFPFQIGLVAFRVTLYKLEKSDFRQNRSFLKNIILSDIPSKSLELMSISS